MILGPWNPSFLFWQFSTKEISNPTTYSFSIHPTNKHPWSLSPITSNNFATLITILWKGSLYFLEMHRFKRRHENQVKYMANGQRTINIILFYSSNSFAKIHQQLIEIFSAEHNLHIFHKPEQQKLYPTIKSYLYFLIVLCTFISSIISSCTK